MREIILATAFAALTVGSAQAGPLLAIEVFDGINQIGSTVTSSTGVIGFVGSDANFADVQVSGQGVGVLANPDLSTTTLQATAASGIAGPVTLTVEIKQTGLTPFTGEQATTGTYNALIGSPGPSIEDMYANGVLIVSDTLTPPVNAFGPVDTAESGITSDAEIYQLTFDAGGQSSSGTMQFVADTVDEPGAFAILGMALMFTGMVFERRRRARAGVSR